MKATYLFLTFAIFLLGVMLASALAGTPLEDQQRIQFTGGISQADAQKRVKKELRKSGYGHYRQIQPLMWARRVGVGNDALIAYYMSPGADSTIICIAVDEHTHAIRLEILGSYPGFPDRLSRLFDRNAVLATLREQTHEADFTPPELMFVDRTAWLAFVDCTPCGPSFWRAYSRSSGEEFYVAMADTSLAVLKPEDLRISFFKLEREVNRQR